MNKWISVKERLPEMHESVLVCLNVEMEGEALVFAVMSREFFGIDGWSWEAPHDGPGNCLMPLAVTHWMPLPEPPK